MGMMGNACGRNPPFHTAIHVRSGVQEVRIYVRRLLRPCYTRRSHGEDQEVRRLDRRLRWTTLQNEAERLSGPDFHTYVECYFVHECSLIMAKMVSPPRGSAYLKKQHKLAKHYGCCWPLHYQMEDRWRHEQIPELHRKESKKYDRRVFNGFCPGSSGEDSEF